MHDKRRWQWAVYYNCCIVIVVGGEDIFTCICLAFVIAKDERDRNVRHVISTTNNVLTAPLNAMTMANRCNYNPTMATMALMPSRCHWYHGRQIITLTDATQWWRGG